MPKSFFPRTDSGMFTWSEHLAAKLLAAPEAYGVTQEAAAELAALQADYAAAYLRASDPSTRTRSAVIGRRAALAALKAAARRAVMAVRADPGVTDAQKVDLGLTVPVGGGGGRPPPPPPPARWCPSCRWTGGWCGPS
jgi:hypothetical protein